MHPCQLLQSFWSSPQHSSLCESFRVTYYVLIWNAVTIPSCGWRWRTKLTYVKSFALRVFANFCSILISANPDSKFLDLLVWMRSRKKKCWSSWMGPDVSSSSRDRGFFCCERRMSFGIPQKGQHWIWNPKRPSSMTLRMPPFASHLQFHGCADWVDAVW